MEARVENRNERKTKKESTPHGDPEQPTLLERDGKIIIHIPMAFKRRGGRKEIILPPGCKLNDDGNGPTINRSLAVALALGHRWLGLLMEGKVHSVSEIAESVGIHPSNVRRFLTLTCLSPRIVKSILNGREPDGLSLEGLREVPIRWEELGTLPII